MNVQPEESASLRGVLGHAGPVPARGVLQKEARALQLHTALGDVLRRHGVSSAGSLSQDCEHGGDHADCVPISESFKISS